MPEMMGRDDLLHQLEPTVEELFNRHLDKSEPWKPHQLIPYGRGEDYEPDYEWSPEDARMAGYSIDESVRSALVVNLLTEDNLPYYFRTVERMFGPDNAWGAWVRRWTAEEGRHSMAIYGYLAVTNAVDLNQLEDDRLVQVSGGQIPEPKTLQDGFVYLALQELATRISHRATGKMLGDPVGYEVMARVANDENLHQLFYRDLAKAAIEVDPDGMMIAIERQVNSFEMPGAGIPNFKEHASRIAAAGIYDLAVHYDKILVPDVVRSWDALNIAGLSGEAAAAQESLGKRLDKYQRVAERIKERRIEAAESNVDSQP